MNSAAEWLLNLDEDTARRLDDDRKRSAAADMWRGGTRGLINLRHHAQSFTGCLSVVLRGGIREDRLFAWKADPSGDVELTEGMAADVSGVAAGNRYDVITTPPPSASRNIRNYCAWEMARLVAVRLGLPFVPLFPKRDNKKWHGRFHNIKQGLPLVDDQHVEAVRGRVVLLVDDTINSGWTMKACFEVLRGLGCHVDGVAWLNWADNRDAEPSGGDWLFDVSARGAQ